MPIFPGRKLFGDPILVDFAESILVQQSKFRDFDVNDIRRESKFMHNPAVFLSDIPAKDKLPTLADCSCVESRFDLTACECMNENLSINDCSNFTVLCQ